MAAPEPRSSRSRRTRRALLAATRAEIAAAGSFTADRVAARAGTAPATFYAHFPSKDDALEAAFSAVLDELVAVVDAELSVERLLEEGLPALCRRFVREATGFFGREAAVFRLALARLPASRPLRATYREHQQAVFARYRRFLALGRAAGRLRAAGPGEDPTPIVLMVVTQGLNNPLALGRGADDPVLAELGAVLERLLAPGSPA